MDLKSLSYIMLVSEARAYLSGAPHKDRLLVSLTSIRLGWKDLSGTNALAYCDYPQITDEKSFIKLWSRAQCYKTFFRLSFTNDNDKLEHLSLTGLPNLV